MSKWESMGDCENLGGNSEWAETSHRTFGLSKVGNLPTFQPSKPSKPSRGLELGESFTSHLYHIIPSMARHGPTASRWDLQIYRGKGSAKES